MWLISDIVSGGQSEGKLLSEGSELGVDDSEGLGNGGSISISKIEL
jgi:hypothetical protein